MKRSVGLIFIFCFFRCYAAEDLVFLQTYEQNRQAFVDIAKDHFFRSWPLKNHPDLTTDLALYQNGDSTLIIFSSGIHGIEGYVGSAVQRNLMLKLNLSKNKKNDFLFIHALNPWGMKNNRRVNEKNVDLNRNFLTTNGLYQKKMKIILESVLF